MKISDDNLINMVYDLIAQNPIAGVYPVDRYENKITHDDLTDYVVDVDSTNKTIDFSDGNRTVQLRLTTTHVANPPKKSKFIINGHGYYFQVEDNIDTTKLIDAKVFDSLNDMETAVKRLHKLTDDEVNGMALIIRDNHLICDRGFATAIDEPIEQFINNFQM